MDEVHPFRKPSNRRRATAQPARLVSAVTLAWLLAGGCADRPVVSVIRLVDHRGPGLTQQLRESFHEAWYDMDPHGNVDLVLRRAIREGSAGPLTQVVHLRTVWRAVPGRTVAHRTQINGTISYYLVCGRTGTAYDGAGSVFFERERDGKLYGSIELARLQPTRHLAASAAPFNRAEVSGEFAAVHDPRRVIQLINEMEGLFGAAPSNRAK